MTDKMMKEAIFTFQIPSKTSKNLNYKVGLLRNGGGWCECEAFWNGVYPCSHIVEAWSKLTPFQNEMWQAAIKKLK